MISQQAGLATLMAIATQAPLATDIPAWRAPSEGLARPLVGPAEDGGSRAGPIGRLARLLRADHLLRNSLYLVISYGAQSALGFAFWIIVARLYSAADVGRASSLISATSLIAFFAIFGLNAMLVRYLPTAGNEAALVTATLILCAASGALIGLGYVVLTPTVAPRLAFIDQPLKALGFAVLAAAASINLLTDGIFIAKRRASLCAVTDGAIGGISKLLLGIALAGTGAYGLYSASVGGSAAAAVASVLLIVIVFRWRPTLNGGLSALKPLVKFSAANYAASSFTLLPSVVTPLIVLDRLGPKTAGYYFVAFQMALLLYTSVYAVEQAFLAEGSQAQANWREVRRRSRRIATVAFVPGGVVLAVAARWLLLAFGSGYSGHGTGGLQLLAAAVLPITICNWSWTVFRLSGRLGALTLSAGIYAVGICAAAWIFAPHGLTAVCAAWFVGASLAASVASVSLYLGRRDERARHRRSRADPVAGSPLP